MLTPIWNRLWSVGLAALSLVVLAGSSGWAARMSAPVMLPGQGCTTFYGADGNVVLGGNNEDFINPLTYVWFIPPQKGRFGIVAFGYDDQVPQGMVNDQGLFYDGLALPYKAINAAGRPNPPDGQVALLKEIFATSSTVEQAQDLLGRYNMDGLQTAQLFFGDRNGHSLIVDGNTILPKSGRFQVATNFRQAEVPASSTPNDKRFNTATQMLSQASAFSIDLFRAILDAVHQEGATPTQYSQVYDLKNGLIYLYQFHDFDDVVVIDIAAELAKGPHSSAISALFPKNEAREEFAFQPLLQYQVDARTRENPEADPIRLQDYAGMYQNPADPDGLDTHITFDAGQLYLQNTGMPAVQLLPETGESFIHPFFLRGTELNITFHRDLLKQVTGADVRLMAQSMDVIPLYHLEKKAPPVQPVWVVFAIAGVGLLVLLGLLAWALLRLKSRRMRAHD